MGNLINNGMLSACAGKLDVADPDFLQKALLLAQLSEAPYGTFGSSAAPVVAAPQSIAQVARQMLNLRRVFGKTLSKLHSLSY